MCSMKKGVLGNFAKFTGKHLCQSLFLNKVVGRHNTSGRLLLQLAVSCFRLGKSSLTIKYCQGIFGLVMLEFLAMSLLQGFSVYRVLWWFSCSVILQWLGTIQKQSSGGCAKVSFVIKPQAEACNFIKKGTLAQVLRNLFLQSTFGSYFQTISEIVIQKI